MPPCDYRLLIKFSKLFLLARDQITDKKPDEQHEHDHDNLGHLKLQQQKVHGDNVSVLHDKYDSQYNQE
jgi:hypothetical protein